MCPSTPLRSEPNPPPSERSLGASSAVEVAIGPQAAGLSDTERPPGVIPFTPEPASGVEGISQLGPRAEAEAAGVADATSVGPPPAAALFDDAQSAQNASAPSKNAPNAQDSRSVTTPLLAPPPVAPPPVAPVRATTMLHAGAPPVAPSPTPPDAAALTRRCTACDTRYPADFLVCPRDASPLVDESTAALTDPLLGKLLGETYQIVRVVGEGGMGRVYEARHLRLKERRFAVKTLHSDLAKNQEIVARFLREAESASSLSHPNVVDVFDVHHLPDGIPYFVGEFLEGEELADFVKARGPLTPQMAAAVGGQICRALSAAHSRGIVHRDMKPENVFVLRSSVEAFAAGEVQALTVKVLDFGISKAGGVDTSHLTKTGVIMGTPSYMSPEQARGKHVDLRADVYSTGAVLYFAITGKRPFDADDPTSTISMVLTQDPPRPRSIDARIPEALELIVQRAMAKEPRDRFQTMPDLERALSAFEEGGRMVLVGQQAPSDPPLDLTAASGAERALDIAKRMFTGSAPAAAQSASLARVARPTISVTSAILGGWLVGGTTAALAGLVRVLHDGEITLTECILLVVGVVFAAATPLALYVLHVKKVIWPNSVRAVQLASDLKRTATAALVAYGLLSITARIGHTVLVRSSRGLASGWWDIFLFLASIACAITVGGFGPLVRNLRRRRSS